MIEFVQSSVTGLTLGAIYALLGLGFVIVYKATDVVNFAQPALMILGAFWVSHYATVMGMPFWVALAGAIAATALIAAVCERIFMRPMVGQPVFAAVMVTIGLDIVLRVIANRMIGFGVRGVADPWRLDRMELLGLLVFQRDVAVILMTVVIVAGLGAFFKYTRVGLAMRATAFDQETALAQGVPVARVFALSWVIAGALAAVAGMFVGTGAGFDQTSAFIALKALPAIILGGLDSILGAIVGGVVIGLAEMWTGTYQSRYFPWLGANFDQVVPYVVMLIVLLVRPYGIWGTPEIERV
jgi:branched-chain amino acid transport system permease protein